MLWALTVAIGVALSALYSIQNTHREGRTLDIVRSRPKTPRNGFPPLRQPASDVESRPDLQ